MISKGDYIQFARGRHSRTHIARRTPKVGSGWCESYCGMIYPIRDDDAGGQSHAGRCWEWAQGEADCERCIDAQQDEMLAEAEAQMDPPAPGAAPVWRK